MHIDRENYLMQRGLIFPLASDTYKLNWFQYTGQYKQFKYKTMRLFRVVINLNITIPLAFDETKAYPCIEKAIWLVEWKKLGQNNYFLNF